MKTSLLLLLLISLALGACKKKEDGITEKRQGCTDKAASNFDPEAQVDDGTCKYPGCTDPKALNYDPGANDEGGTCKYTNVTFYARQNYSPLFEQVERVYVYIDGEQLGVISPASDRSNVYHDGLKDCNAAGTVTYAFKSSETVNWKTITYLRQDCGGRYRYDSGTVAPGKLECMTINVTPEKYW